MPLAPKILRPAMVLRPRSTMYARSFPSVFAAALEPRHEAAGWMPGHDGNANDMGGPGGQELYPASKGLRKKFEYETLAGVMLALSIMGIAKFAQTNYDKDAEYLLVHDNTRGELDDVKYIKVPARASVPTVTTVQRWA
ncbi:hypothetical protein QBC38DRAFT_447957 [Podospora fimiseda]|uniref:Uncharacterized protein n=1 Tax=Podospora fimiseda TaxID=252190 RepID=A0AAN6YPA4_9PEZI|nr:hypothetical protein QBC38DRAFT_447957 [Podospora fimiseda]